MRVPPRVLAGRPIWSTQRTTTVEIPSAVFLEKSRNPGGDAVLYFHDGR